MNLKSKLTSIDTKEKLIVAGVMSGIFLPVRLLFYTYISQYWGFSFGMVSSIAILMFVLCHYNKLGAFSHMFKRQMGKASRGKIGKVFLGITIFCMAVNFSYIIGMDRGANVWHDEGQRLLAILVVSDTRFAHDLQNGIGLPEGKYIFEAQQMTEDQKGRKLVSLLSNSDFFISYNMHLLNVESEGWLMHFLIVGLVGEFEAMGVTMFYRRVYKNYPEPLPKHLQDMVSVLKLPESQNKEISLMPKDEGVIVFDVPMKINKLDKFVFGEKIATRLAIKAAQKRIACNPQKRIETPKADCQTKPQFQQTIIELGKSKVLLVPIKKSSLHIEKKDSVLL